MLYRRHFTEGSFTRSEGVFSSRRVMCMEGSSPEPYLSLPSSGADSFLFVWCHRIRRVPLPPGNKCSPSTHYILSKSYFGFVWMNFWYPIVFFPKSICFCLCCNLCEVSSSTCPGLYNIIARYIPYIYTALLS